MKEAGQSYAVSKPDYIWHDHYWELKSLSSPKAVDSALRKAVRQIHDRPGGVILDFGKNTITISSVESAIRSRLEAVCKFSVDIIIVNKGKLIKVLRYKLTKRKGIAPPLPAKALPYLNSIITIIRILSNVTGD